jgi:hypothetical protein
LRRTDNVAVSDPKGGVNGAHAPESGRHRRLALILWAVEFCEKWSNLSFAASRGTIY